MVTQVVAAALELPFVHLDPLQLDYKLVTSAFGGPFAERHLIVAIDDTDAALTIAMADPWDNELVESIARVKNKKITVVVAPKTEILGIIVEFHGFRRSMRAAEEDFASDFPDLGNLEQLYELKRAAATSTPRQAHRRAVWYCELRFLQRASDIHPEPKRDEVGSHANRWRFAPIHRLPKVAAGQIVASRCSPVWTSQSVGALRMDASRPASRMKRSSFESRPFRLCLVKKWWLGCSIRGHSWQNSRTLASSRGSWRPIGACSRRPQG